MDVETKASAQRWMPRMLPKPIQISFSTCELLAFDDGQQTAFIRMDTELFEIRYEFLQQVDGDSCEACEQQLRNLLAAFGCKIDVERFNK